MPIVAAIGPAPSPAGFFEETITLSNLDMEFPFVKFYHAALPFMHFIQYNIGKFGVW
jgi:hypothetical protein